MSWMLAIPLALLGAVVAVVLLSFAFYLVGFWVSSGWHAAIETKRRKK